MPSSTLSTKFNELQESLRLKREKLKNQKETLSHNKWALDASNKTLSQLNSQYRDLADRELATAIMYDRAPKLFRKIDDAREELDVIWNRTAERAQNQRNTVIDNRFSILDTRLGICKDGLSLFACTVKMKLGL